MKTTFKIKDRAGRGFLAVNHSTAFDLPRNWTTEKKARTFDTFAEASAEVQAGLPVTPARPSVEIVSAFNQKNPLTHAQWQDTFDLASIPKEKRTASQTRRAEFYRAEYGV